MSLSYEGKIVQSIEMSVLAVDIKFKDGTRLVVIPKNEHYLQLIEPTLDSDVVPIGVNALGESSV